MNIYAPKNIDKIEAQLLYDGGMSLRKLAEHYAVAIKTIQRLNLITRNTKDARALQGYVMTNDKRKEASERAKSNGLGGYRPHPNRGHYYKDIWFDSNWEIRVAKSLDENNIVWERPKVGFVWTDTNRKYYPDFYLPEYNVYLDPKNPYLQLKDKEKIDQAQLRNNIRVITLNEDQLEWKAIALLVITV